MNKYLLLRDNKQSGPYLATELAAHGIKPYDLVWLEGKSAAWRYPGEMEELKPFAPQVEEQPFDRFYKKSEIKIDESSPKDHSAIAENPVVEKRIAEISNKKLPSPGLEEKKISAFKKIHVSLPGTKSAESLARVSSETPVPYVPPVEKVVPLTKASQGKESFSALNHGNKMYDVPYTNTKDTYKVTNPTQGIGEAAPVSKFLFRSVAAACLLLAGALIGLIINFNNHQKKYQQLDQLVQQIKEQKNVGISKSVKNENSIDDVIISNEIIKPGLDANNAVSSGEQPIYKEDIRIPVTKKDRSPVKPVEKVNAAEPADLHLNEEIVPAVLQQEEATPKSEKVASELARKNLWQLVSVDNNRYKTGVLGGISNLVLKLSNKSLYQLDQVEVEVKYLGPEKKVVNTQKIVFENVSPGEQLSIEVPKSSRGVKIDYTIKKISTKELGLAYAGM